jgi:hypothetical protein
MNVTVDGYNDPIVFTHVGQIIELPKKEPTPADLASGKIVILRATLIDMGHGRQK